MTLGEGPGPRGRIGFIALANGHVSELEVMEMVPRDEVVVYVNRVADEDAVTLGNLRRIGADMSRAASGILPDGHIDVMVYGCTSGTVALGEEGVSRRIRKVRPGVPVTTPITAALAAFRALDVERIVLLTPYPFEVVTAVEDYLAERGVRALHSASFNIANGSDMNRVPPDAIRHAAVALDRPGADAIFICCTALRACRIIDAVEERVGKPVVTSNQALAWHALRLMGYDDTVPGYGRLMRSPLAAAASPPSGRAT